MSPARKRLLPWIALAVVYVVWGSTYMGIALVVREMPPLGAAALRFFAAGVVMAAIAFFVDRAHGFPGRRALLDYALIGVLLLAGGNGLVMWSETRVPSGIAALIVASVPLWITLFDGMRAGGQRWTLRVWLGVALGLLGAGLVARPQDAVAGHWGGVAALQVACLLWTAGTLYAQSVPRRLPIFTASAVEMLAGSAVLALESRLLGEDLGRIATAGPTAWWALVYLAVFGSLLAFTCFAYCLNELPATTVGTYAYVNPVVAVFLGAVFLHEPVSTGLVAGAVLVLGAVVLTTRRGAEPADPTRAASPPADPGQDGARAPVPRLNAEG
ncbi:MAG TPA: EamA family transporter [Vicinamibacteria bacterium]|jgi:drug/metabolite transporter (DMT)-like permease